MERGLSKAQLEHIRENEEAKQEAQVNSTGKADGEIKDKKLDGPNRPSE